GDTGKEQFCCINGFARTTVVMGSHIINNKVVGASTAEGASGGTAAVSLHLGSDVTVAHTTTPFCVWPPRSSPPCGFSPPATPARLKCEVRGYSLRSIRFPVDAYPWTAGAHSAVARMEQRGIRGKRPHGKHAWISLRCIQATPSERAQRMSHRP